MIDYNFYGSNLQDLQYKALNKKVAKDNATSMNITDSVIGQLQANADPTDPNKKSTIREYDLKEQNYNGGGFDEALDGFVGEKMKETANTTVTTATNWDGKSFAPMSESANSNVNFNQANGKDISGPSSSASGGGGAGGAGAMAAVGAGVSAVQEGVTMFQRDDSELNEGGHLMKNLSMGMKGAQFGMMVGGPWGAAIGGIVGTVAGIIDSAIDIQKGKIKKRQGYLDELDYLESENEKRYTYENQSKALENLKDLSRAKLNYYNDNNFSLNYGTSTD